jgi:hypothetical protein
VSPLRSSFSWSITFMLLWILKVHNLVGFEVLTAVSTKIAVFWVVAPCSLVEVYLWSVSKLLPDYIVLQPRRQPSFTYFYYFFILGNCLLIQSVCPQNYHWSRTLDTCDTWGFFFKFYWMYTFYFACLRSMYFVACNCLNQIIFFSLDTKDLFF